MNLAGVGFGAGKQSRFETWLCRQLESCAYNALDVRGAIVAAVEDLALDRGEVVRLLVRSTRRGGDFKSDGELITFR